MSIRYRINHEAMQRVSVLGSINPETGVRARWQPREAMELLEDYLEDPEFDLERVCGRCRSYDREMGLMPEDKYLPKSRRVITTYDRNPVGLPWEPGKPREAVRLHPRQKSRPGKPQSLDGCHMCVFSYLDEVPASPISEEQRGQLVRGEAHWSATCRRLRRAAENPASTPALQVWAARELEKATSRLREVQRLCHRYRVPCGRQRARLEEYGDE